MREDDGIHFFSALECCPLYIYITYLLTYLLIIIMTCTLKSLVSYEMILLTLKYEI